jgi:hypothetical protein
MFGYLSNSPGDLTGKISNHVSIAKQSKLLLLFFILFTVAVRRFNFIVKHCRRTLLLQNLNIVSYHSKVETFIVKKVRKSIEFRFYYLLLIKIFKIAENGSKKVCKAKKKNSKKGGINLGKKERNQIKNW